MAFTEKTNLVLDFFYHETKIKPKYIIFCNGKERKIVYQYEPKEIKSKVKDQEIIHQTYIQNTINNHSDIGDYTHAIIVSDNNKEYEIENNFFLKTMFNDIKNSYNREYTISHVINMPVSVTTEYDDKEKQHNKTTIIDKKKIGIIGACFAIIGIGLFGKKKMM